MNTLQWSVYTLPLSIACLVDNSVERSIDIQWSELTESLVSVTMLYIMTLSIIHDIQLVSLPGGASSEVLNISVECKYC